ncbi:hypothetical protein O6H91_08G105200 [Diphasiastrum complanatum]|uniref:Uncharacterized protein n=2 Tax=Diphasiastrum complanatum TaxID=34168 RepID=A0ACC2D110_DIPCM|nr:hypothetical protein O6H91_08G105200 [Diphasiastrum complanatum]
MAEGGGRDHNRGGFDQNRQAGGYRTDRDGNAGGYGGQMDRDGESASSRADESRDWGASKKHMPWQAGQHYGDERRGNRANDQELPSRADEVDNWSSLKKFVISQGLDRKALPPHSEERKGGFEEGAGPRIVSRADEAGSWGAGKKFVSGEREGTDLVHKSGGMPQVDESRPVERPRLILLPRSQIVDASVPSAIPSKETPVGKGSEILESDPSMPDIQLPKPKPRSNPFGAARPREEILAEKGQDWRKFEAELENREREIRNSLPSTPDGAPQRWTRLPLKYEPHGQGRENSRPSSSHSSRPQTPDLSAQLGTKSRAKVNPFGDAKPREILLEEKGKDWRRIDFELEHRSVERLDTEEETKLKKEIKALEELLNNNIESRNEKIMYGVLNEKAEKEGGMKLNVKEELIHKEKELEDLTRALDDKIRYSQRSVDRPPSRGGHSDSGRTSEPSRPSSRAGRSDFGRGIEPANFPKGIDIWIRPTAGSDLNRPLTYRDRDRRTFERW